MATATVRHHRLSTHVLRPAVSALTSHKGRQTYSVRPQCAPHSASIPSPSTLYNYPSDTERGSSVYGAGLSVAALCPTTCLLSVGSPGPPSVTAVCPYSSSLPPRQRLPPIRANEGIPRHPGSTTVIEVRRSSVLPHACCQSIRRGHRPSTPSVCTRLRSSRVSAYLP